MVGGTGKKINKLVIFRALFFFFFSFSEWFFFVLFFNISRKNSKTSEVNQKSVLYLYIFHNFPKNLDRTMITLNSVTLKSTQTEPQKYTIFFQLNK